MMATTTTNYGLTKPDYTDAADIAVLNANFDKIDTTLKTKAAATTSVSGTLTAAGWTGSAAPYTQTLTVSGLAAAQNGAISVAQSASAAARAAALKAKLSVTGQAAGTLTITADGTLPTVDIPVTAVLLG